MTIRTIANTARDAEPRSNNKANSIYMYMQVTGVRFQIALWSIIRCDGMINVYVVPVQFINHF
jgi:hypothetical protein